MLTYQLSAVSHQSSGKSEASFGKRFRLDLIIVSPMEGGGLRYRRRCTDGREDSPICAILSIVADKTLHVVDGESSGGTLKASGIATHKDILRWKDALYTGPVPAGLSLKELSAVRSRFWTRGKRQDEFKRRNAQLQSWKEYDEVVLWFGSTSICQLSLVQILTWFSERQLRDTRLSLVRAYAGTLRLEQIIGCYTARKPVTAQQMELGKRIWRAFTAPSPLPLQRLLRTNLRVLPEARETILQLLQEYPDRLSGLSRFERLLLAEISGVGTGSAAFAVALIIRQQFVGDLLLFDMLRQFVIAPNPLLSFTKRFKGRIESYRFNASKLRVTELGEKVFAGKTDRIALNGIDRWIGGAHLKGNRVRCRWDEEQHRIISLRA